MKAMQSVSLEEKKVRKIMLVCFLFSFGTAFAQSSINLPTPQTIVMSAPVSTFLCSAYEVTVVPYATDVTGFSADGNYVTGQVSAHFTCGHSGRGSTIHTYYSCAQLTWDLSGNLVSATDTTQYGSNGAPVSYSCPDLGLVLPSRTPPSSETVGNSFTNAGGYTAETLLVQQCGSIACYGLPLAYPTLLTP
jgi:hypothetical protein